MAYLLNKLLTGKKVPSLEVNTLDGKIWKLSAQKPEKLTLIIFYRGCFCPICKSYGQEINKNIPQFEQLGVKVIYVSGDSHEKAQESQQTWQLDKLPIGYGVSLQTMRDWGVYISEGVQENEPPTFSEPAFFLVKDDGTLYYVGLNSNPFGRPSIQEMLGGIEFLLSNDYPTRGTEI
nr:peroxiredoxin-like family protein [Cyanobacterium sp. IPPAS B-1200]OEJ77707.1 alkyl hydroperoxide reductase [Cyanobacterium sp. IPPAS B-1200]